MPEEKNLCVVHEAIIGAFGLPPGKLYVSIKGDPSLRKPYPCARARKAASTANADKVLETCGWLLRKTGCHGIYIGFNSSEVRTESVFKRPYRETQPYFFYATSARIAP